MLHSGWLAGAPLGMGAELERTMVGRSFCGSNAMAAVAVESWRVPGTLEQALERVWQLGV